MSPLQTRAPALYQPAAGSPHDSLAVQRCGAAFVWFRAFPVEAFARRMPLFFSGSITTGSELKRHHGGLAQASHLGTVLARIRKSVDVLRRWAAAGEQLYGLARPAAALEADPYSVEALGAGTRAVARDALKDFRGSSETHYLYVACVARDPVDKELKGWFDALRMWLLVHGLERAARDKPIVCDEGLADARRLGRHRHLRRRFDLPDPN